MHVDIAACPAITPAQGRSYPSELQRRGRAHGKLISMAAP
jgi:hypothetical protein